MEPRRWVAASPVNSPDAAIRWRRRQRYLTGGASDPVVDQRGGVRRNCGSGAGIASSGGSCACSPGLAEPGSLIVGARIEGVPGSLPRLAHYSVRTNAGSSVLAAETIFGALRTVEPVAPSRSRPAGGARCPAVNCRHRSRAVSANAAAPIGVLAAAHRRPAVCHCAGPVARWRCSADRTSAAAVGARFAVIMGTCVRMAVWDRLESGGTRMG